MLVAILVPLTALNQPARAADRPADATNTAVAGAAVADANVSFALTKAAADAGDPAAMLELSGLYLQGRGVATNLTSAFEYARMASEKGYAPGQAQLASMYGRGRGVEKDAARAAGWYRKAADQNYALAQFALGGLYERGAGVTNDIDQALSWYQKAADQGYAAAQCQLGLIYFNGVQGDPRHPVNLNQAVIWLKKAADQNVAGAMNNLGICFQYGYGGLPKDEKTAAQWCLKAAEADDPLAQINVAQLYVGGTVLPRDLVQAYAWFHISLDSGNANALASLLDFLGNHPLATNDLIRGNAMIKFYHAHPGPLNTNAVTQ